MNRYVAALAAGLCALMVATAGLAAQDAKTTSIWDGVYTEAQAARGEAVYKQECTVCHRDDLRGNIDGGPPLRGLEFFVRWRQISLKDMVTDISGLMPSDDPGSLSRQTYVDIMAFLFRYNGIPAGAVEMPVEDVALSQIIFTEKK